MLIGPHGRTSQSEHPCKNSKMHERMGSAFSFSFQVIYIRDTLVAWELVNCHSQSRTKRKNTDAKKRKNTRDQAAKKLLLLDRPAELLQVFVVRNILIHGGANDLLSLLAVLVGPVLVLRLDS